MNFFGPTLKRLQAPAKLIMLGAFCITALFSLRGLGSIFGNGFFSAIKGLLALAITITLWAIVPALVLLKNEVLAKKIFPIVLFYWLINEIFSLLSSITGTYKAQGLFAAISAFDFLIALLIVAAVAVFIMGLMRNTNSNGLSYTLGLFALPLYFMTFIFFIFVGIKYGSSWGFIDFLGTLINSLVLPAGVFFGALYFYPAD